MKSDNKIKIDFKEFFKMGKLNLNYIKTTRNRTKGIQKALIKQITDMKKKR